MTPLVLALAVVLQQQIVRQPAPAAGDSAREAMRQVIIDVGRGVANTRSTYELLRRAVFNSADAQVIEKARQMQQRCRELETIVRAAPRRLCRSCFAAAVQRVVDAYRTGLPAVGQVGARCVRQLTQDLRSRDAAAAVRASIRTIGQSLTGGLYSYEAKLADVRRVFGLVGSQTAPARRR